MVALSTGSIFAKKVGWLRIGQANISEEEGDEEVSPRLPPELNPACFFSVLCIVLFRKVFIAQPFSTFSRHPQPLTLLNRSFQIHNSKSYKSSEKAAPKVLFGTIIRSFRASGGGVGTP